MEKKSGKHRRHILMVDRDYQLKYLIYQDLGELLALGVVLFLSFVIMFWQIAGDRVENVLWADKAVEYYLILLVLLLLIWLVYRSLIRSHQIAGPFIRFKEDFHRMQQGDLSGSFQLRKRDRLHTLAEDYRLMKEGLRDLIQQERDFAEKNIRVLHDLRAKLEPQLEGLEEQKQQEILADFNTLTEHLKNAGKQFILTAEEDATLNDGANH